MQSLNAGVGFSVIKCMAVYARCLATHHKHNSTKLFIGGLSFDTNETVLKDAFDKYGEIVEVKVICNHVNGKSRGYGFVHFTSEDSANKALEQMNDQLLDGRNIRVHYAHKG